MGFERMSTGLEEGVNEVHEQYSSSEKANTSGRAKAKATVIGSHIYKVSFMAPFTQLFY
jgi:hypothetical protein